MPARGTDRFNPLATTLATNPAEIGKCRCALERPGGPRALRAVCGGRRSVCFRTTGAVLPSRSPARGAWSSNP